MRTTDKTDVRLASYLGRRILVVKQVGMIGAVGVVLVLLASHLAGQSLADVARQEEARRKTVRSSGKVYTNDSLRGEPAPVQSPAAEISHDVPAPPPSAPQAGQGSPADGTVPPAVSAPKTEAEWRKQAADAREALSRAQTFAEALQSRINALSTDYVNRDDPAQRDVVAADRQKAMAELDRVKREIQERQKAIASIQDAARRAGVPAGWVR